MDAKRVAGDRSAAGYRRKPGCDAYSDVKHACNRFLRDRIARGLMKDLTALMGKTTPPQTVTKKK
jgi:hypothetical protein